ncbi:hypothetical protein OG785_33345 [Streptomyces sp. NBC_00006]|uniref:hypothetical protein n=1 Tax=Streptomyces sp. NBC_00006 TaxID=2975619 RepID=UPI002257F5DC|nr:hypothetical protein [Streptomyces sp. NBC_00006]MCX5535425.1 hypothetical protein [Streptomyces sp. NBC_00006]
MTDVFENLRKTDPEREATEAARAAGRQAKLAKAGALAEGDLVGAAIVEVDRIEAQLKAAEEAEGEMLFRLTSGTGAPVKREALEQARRDVDFFAKQLVGAGAKLDRARDEMRLRDLEQLAKEVAEFADSTSSPARRAAKAYKAADEALREALAAVEEHNKEVAAFKARARELDAPESRGPAYPAEPVAFDFGKLVSGPYVLDRVDGRQMAAYVVNIVNPDIDTRPHGRAVTHPYKDVGALASVVSGVCNRKMPDAERFYYRDADGYSFAFDQAPGLIEAERRGLKKIPADQVWDWARKVKR